MRLSSTQSYAVSTLAERNVRDKASGVTVQLKSNNLQLLIGSVEGKPLRLLSTLEHAIYVTCHLFTFTFSSYPAFC